MTDKSSESTVNSLGMAALGKGFANSRLNRLFLALMGPANVASGLTGSERPENVRRAAPAASAEGLPAGSTGGAAQA